MDHQQPQKDDAVLGGQGLMPNSIVLGGLEGVKQRLSSAVVEHRIASLSEAANYGNRGITLVIRALRDPVIEVQQAAYSLLKQRPEPIAQRAVEQYYVQTHYGHLEQLLAAGNWKAADQESRIVLLQACGIDPFAVPSPAAANIADCPCRDLQIVDRFWHRYSKGRFGFSVQQSIWQPLDQLYWDKAEVWMQFGDRVGWRGGRLFGDRYWKRYPELTFSLHAPVGHLPFLGDAFGIFTVELISDRLTFCQTNA